MRICIDMDGTICETRMTTEKYIDVKPKPGAIEFLKQIKKDGHEIIIYSSRNMAAHDNNTAKIVAVQGPIFKEWFDRHGVEYDELMLGKPLADVYIDDKAIRYDGNWESIYKKIT